MIWKVFRCIFLFFFLNSLCVRAGEDPKQLKRKATEFSKKGLYQRADSVYQILLGSDSLNFQLNFESAILEIEHTGDYIAAEKKLARISLQKSQSDPELSYWYARALHLNSKFSMAKSKYEQVLSKVENDDEGKEMYLRLRKYIQECENGLALENIYNPRISASNLGQGLNSRFSDYVPVFIKRDSFLLFTSRRPGNMGGKIDEADGNFYEDLFFSQYKNGNFQSGTLLKSKNQHLSLKNTSDHESVVSVSYDDRFILYYKENKLWYSEFKNEKWTSPVAFPNVINRGSFQPHACFSNNGERLYFSSNMPGGFGGLDLYYSEKDKEGNWQEPINLGKDINTPYDEDAPFYYAPTNTLYFSSKGHNTMGGYDVFATEPQSDNRYLFTRNIGHPVNSPADDVFFSLINNNPWGFFSSNRGEGEGLMDNYIFDLTPSVHFKNCLPATSAQLEVTLDATASVDEGGVPVMFVWDFGDGSLATGKKVTHNFRYPALFEVHLHVIDSLSGNLELDEYVVEVDLRDGDFIGFVSPDTVTAGKSFQLNATSVRINGFDKFEFYWKIDGIDYKPDSVVVYPVINSTGLHKIKMGVIASNDSIRMESCRCIEKNIMVIGEQLAVDNHQPEIVMNNPDSKNQFEKERAREAVNAISNQVKKSFIDPTYSFNSTAKVEDDSILPVFFEYDQFELSPVAKQILDRNFKILMRNSDVFVTVNAHTDCRGSSAYNMQLSARRSNAVINYFLNKGLKRNRIFKVNNFGESIPVNQCSDDHECNETEHAQNRRVEFDLKTIDIKS